MTLKHTLLYLDDEPINLEIFAGCFENTFEVITANSGRKGLEILEVNTNIAIVVSDMKMPEMNGIEFIRIAKEKYHNITYFILTGFDLNEEILGALNDGLIYSYFSKPIDYEIIGSSIQEAIKNTNKYS